MAISTLDILCCQITIGDADSKNPMVIKNPTTLYEVQNIEIHESYKKLIGTAKSGILKASLTRPRSRSDRGSISSWDTMGY